MDILENIRDRARRAARGRKAFAGREARRAVVELRWLELDVPVPRGERGRLGRDPVRLTAVHALEPAPPSGAEGLEWLLRPRFPSGPRTTRAASSTSAP